MSTKNLIYLDNNPKKVDFDTICNYGLYPINSPMDVDSYKFKLKSGFLDNLSKLYEDIKSQGDKFTIEDVQKVSPKLFLRDILTNYVVQNIFQNKTQNDLIHIINRIMTSMYDQFYKETGIKLFFVYRGGNILNLYKTTFEEILPGQSKKVFQEEFSEYFKNSDIDFYTIIQDSNKMTKEEIFSVNSYIQMMCYYGLYVARIFIMNNFDLFEFCKYNKVTMGETFQEMIEKMNQEKLESEFDDIKKAKFIGIGFNNFMYLDDKKKLDDILNMKKDKTFSEFIHNADDLEIFENYIKYGKSGRPDINISPEEDSAHINTIDYVQKNLFKEDFQKDMKALLRKNKILDYYISNNNEIFNKEDYVDFSLVRLMLNFVIVYKNGNKYGMTNSSSELFDLSIGHPDDKVYHVYTEKGVVPYEFTYGDDKTDTIYVPRIPTMILDLIKILFGKFPWDDPKYKKRLYRLLILLFIKELSGSTITEMEKKLKSKKIREYKNEFDNTFETLLYRNKEMKDRLPKKLVSKHKEYLKTYHEIIQKLLNVLNKLKTFVDAKNQIAKKDVYIFE